MKTRIIICQTHIFKAVVQKTNICIDKKRLSEKNYDKQNESHEFLENIPKNKHFFLQGKEFIKGELRRKRFLCEEVSTKKKYLIHTLAEVIPIFE